MDSQDKFELVVNAGLQAIPYVGSSIAALYFGAKQEKRFERIEQTMKEIADDLKGVPLANADQHNKEELLSLIEEWTDSIEKEHLESKRALYKRYFEKILMTPSNGNYEERKLFLDILKQITPLQVELLAFLFDHPNVLDTAIQKQGTDSVMIKSAVLQLQNHGLIEAKLESIFISDISSSMPQRLIVSEVGKRFKEFCLE